MYACFDYICSDCNALNCKCVYSYNCSNEDVTICSLMFNNCISGTLCTCCHLKKCECSAKQSLDKNDIKNKLSDSINTSHSELPPDIDIDHMLIPLNDTCSISIEQNNEANKNTIAVKMMLRLNAI